METHRLRWRRELSNFGAEFSKSIPLTATASVILAGNRWGRNVLRGQPFPCNFPIRFCMQRAKRVADLTRLTLYGTKPWPFECDFDAPYSPHRNNLSHFLRIKSTALLALKQFCCQSNSSFPIWLSDYIFSPLYVILSGQINYCWSSPAQSFLVPSPTVTHDHILLSHGSQSRKNQFADWLSRHIDRQANYCWPSPAQRFSVPSPAGLMPIILLSDGCDALKIGYSI
jgi:hypothetical protein